MTSVDELVVAGDDAARQARFGDAVARYDAAIECFGNSPELDTRRQVAYALAQKADALRAIGATEDAIRVRDELIARFAEDDDDLLRTLVSIAFDRKARALFQLTRYDQALQVRDIELARYELVVPAGRPSARLDAMAGRAIVLSALGGDDEAIAAWGEVLAAAEGTTELGGRRQEAAALVARAGRLRVRGEYDAALTDLERLQRRFARAEDPYITQRLAESLLEQAAIWREMELPDLAIPALDRLTTEFATEVDPLVVNLVTRGLFLRGEDSYAHDQLDAAAEMYDASIERGRDTTEASVWEAVVGAAVGKALVLAARGAVDEALQYFDWSWTETLQRFPGEAVCIARIVGSKIYVLVWAQRHEDVVSLADETVASFANSEEPVLREAVALARLERAFALPHIGRAHEGLSALEEVQQHADESLAVLDEQINRIDGEDDAWTVHRWASRLLLRASILSGLDRDDESADALDTLIQRLADADDPGLIAMVDAARQERAELDCDS